MAPGLSPSQRVSWCNAFASLGYQAWFGEPVGIHSTLTRMSNEWLNVRHRMAPQLPRQDRRRWGNSIGVLLPAAIARGARLHDNQTVELQVVADGVLIWPVQPRLSLAERLAAYTPMEGEAPEAMAWDPIGTEVIE